jgi:hypothetical protein
VAGANKVTPIVNAFYSHINGLFDIKSTYQKPTIAIVEALDLLYYHHQLLKNRIQEQHYKELSDGRK